MKKYTQEEIDKADAAETIADAFEALITLGFETKLDPTSTQWIESRKVFFCGAAFIVDRLFKWQTENDPLAHIKTKAIIDELVKFKDSLAEEKEIHESIEKAWRDYAAPDKD